MRAQPSSHVGCIIGVALGWTPLSVPRSGRGPTKQNAGLFAPMHVRARMSLMDEFKVIRRNKQCSWTIQPDWKMAGTSYQSEHDAKSASEAADKSLELILYKIFMTQSNMLSRKIVMRLLMKRVEACRLHPVHVGDPMLVLHDEHKHEEHTLPIQHSPFTKERALEVIMNDFG